MSAEASPCPGEIRFTTRDPSAPGAGIVFVGTAHTPWPDRTSCPKNARQARDSGREATIEIDPGYASALLGIERASHLIVLMWMHEADRDLAVQLPRHRRERGAQPLGTFALRSPARPNPIGMSVVRLLAVDGPVLTVDGLDCVDGTPVIDIKPYFVSVDSVADATVAD